MRPSQRSMPPLFSKREAAAGAGCLAGTLIINLIILAVVVAVVVVVLKLFGVV